MYPFQMNNKQRIVQRISGSMQRVYGGRSQRSPSMGQLAAVSEAAGVVHLAAHPASRDAEFFGWPAVSLELPSAFSSTAQLDRSRYIALLDWPVP